MPKATAQSMTATPVKSRKDARRSEIIAAARAEFVSKGFAGTSMAAIAHRAKASKETLYSWFENKEELFKSVFEARIDDLNAHASEAMRQNPHPSHVVPIVVRGIVKTFLAMEPLIWAAASAGQRAPTLARSMGESILDERKSFVDYLKWCRTKGFIEFDDDPYELASTFVAMAQGEWGVRVAYKMVDKVTDEMIDAHAQRITRLFLKALAPKKVRK